MSMSVSRGPHHPRARACSHIRTHVCVMKFDVMKYKDSLTKCSDQRNETNVATRAAQ